MRTAQRHGRTSSPVARHGLAAQRVLDAGARYEHARAGEVTGGGAALQLERAQLLSNVSALVEVQRAGEQGERRRAVEHVAPQVEARAVGCARRDEGARRRGGRGGQRGSRRGGRPRTARARCGRTLSQAQQVLAKPGVVHAMGMDGARRVDIGSGGAAGAAPAAASVSMPSRGGAVPEKDVQAHSAREVHDGGVDLAAVGARRSLGRARSARSRGGGEGDGRGGGCRGAGRAREGRGGRGSGGGGGGGGGRARRGHGDDVQCRAEAAARAHGCRRARRGDDGGRCGRAGAAGRGGQSQEA